jgi:uncharacterized protein (TIGR02246 family)
MANATAEQEIRRLDEHFMMAANARDAKTLVSGFYAESAVLMPPNHPMVEGRDAIRTFLQGLIDAGFAGITLETTTIDAAGDLAYGRGRYTLRMSPPGQGTMEDVGKYVVVYRRQGDGAWRAIADIFNSDAGR